MTSIVVPSRSRVAARLGGERKTALDPYWFRYGPQLAIAGNKEIANVRKNPTVSGTLVDQGENVGNISSLGWRKYQLSSFPGLRFGVATGYETHVVRFVLDSSQPNYGALFYGSDGGNNLLNGFYKNGSLAEWFGLGSFSASLYAAMTDGRWHTLVVHYDRPGAPGYAYYTLDGVMHRSDNTSWWNQDASAIYLLSLPDQTSYARGLVSSYVVFSSASQPIPLDEQIALSRDYKQLFRWPSARREPIIVYSGAYIPTTRRRNRLALAMM